MVRRGFRRVVGVALQVLVGLAMTAVARAEDQFPTHPINMIVPFAAGGPTDILGRVVAQAISPILGQQVVVEDVTGAGGTLGATKAARSAPDGYTLVMGNLGTHAASLGIYKNLRLRPAHGFRAGHSCRLYADGPGDAEDPRGEHVDDVIAYAKANKGKTTMGSAGVGSISHLTLLLFNHLTGADVTHVPYRGLSEAANDLSAARSIYCSTRLSRRRHIS